MSSKESKKKTRPIGLRLPLDVFERLKSAAEDERRSVSNYVLLLIERDIEKTGSETLVNPIHAKDQAQDETKKIGFPQGRESDEPVLTDASYP